MKKIILGSIILVIAVTIIVPIYYQFIRRDEIDTAIKEKIYTIVTDEQFVTLQNDGGTHHNVYYVIDFNTKVIKKYEDYYIGFEGYEYKDKLIYEKKLDDDKTAKLNKIIDEILTKEDTNPDKNYNYYIIKDKNEEIKIYNKNNINKLKTILLSIDEI